MGGIMKPKKKKDDTGKYVKQWNEELKQELKQSVNAYVELLKKYKQLKAEFNELKKKNKQLETDYKEANESVTWWGNRYNAIVKQNGEVKKQKDDVVEYIKKYLHEHIIDDLPDEESKFETENGIPIPNAKEILLRMLGEIDD